MRGNPKFGEAGVETRFAKGNKGGGRKPIPEDVKEMARALTPDAIEALGEIMRDKSAPPAARVSAATAILDRAYGKPAQTVNANVTVSVLDTMSDDDLMVLLQGLSERRRQQQAKVIDGQAAPALPSPGRLNTTEH